MDADSGTVAPQQPSGRSLDWSGGAAVLLIGIGGSWSAGNVGPVVGELSAEFEISLTGVGLLSGTIFFLATVAGLLYAPRAAERLGLTRALAVGCALGGAGSVVFALSPDYLGLAVGRVLAGVGLGFAAGLGPVLARATGGIGRVGLFGAAFQLGIALGLGVGSVLSDLDVDWRVGFLITAAVALSAIPFVLGEHIPAELRERTPGFLGAAIRSPSAWRLAALFMAMFAVPLTLGAWFVHYVTVEGSLQPALAGGLAFVLFGVSALMREIGGKLAGRGVSPVLLAGAMPWLAAVGLAAIGLDLSTGVVTGAVLLMAAGFALPYATMMVEGQRLFPAEPARPTALLSMAGTAVSIVTIPVLGAVLAAGEGDAAFLVLAALVALAGVLNLRPAGEPLLAPPEPDASGASEGAND